MGEHSNGSVVEVVALREFFHDSVRQALATHAIRVDDHTEHYVVNVLTMFSRTEDLHAQGETARPLALMLADAHSAQTPQERDRLLRQLGDVSLFTAGFFAGSFARKLVDVDYNIAMGASAYGTLAANARPATVLAGVFSELAQNFQRMVDVLNEIAEQAHPHSGADVLRQYEIYAKTGSPRALKILRGLGITPITAARTTQ